MEERIVCFPPIADSGSRVLVLGTMPSEASLNAGMYYAHPRNHFWPVLFALWNEPTPKDMEARVDFLRRRHIALWDMCASCVRKTSADAMIKSPRPNDIAGLLGQYPGIRRIFLNGKTAEAYFKRWAPERVKETMPHSALPSTSPAYTLPFEEKLMLWQPLYDAAEAAR